LQILLKHPDISIILSDINMPEMDGLTLLTKINEMRIPSLKCIMVSAYGDMDNIRHAMNNGAFDFATKPIDLDDLQITIDKAVEQIEYIRSAQKEHAQLVDIQSDLSVAREIQQAILPRTFDLKLEHAGDIDIYASMLAAKDVGGDFYDFFPIDDHRIGFTIADVSGKGVPAAIFMAVSRTLIKATALRDLASNECLTSVNDILCGESVGSMFVTVFYGIYDLNTGMVDFTNAGHNPPYILHADGKVEMLEADCNLVLGAIEGVQFKSGSLRLNPGDALMMYTDGVTEAENNVHDQFGTERLEAELAGLKGTSSRQIVESVLDRVHAFTDGAPQSDDITQLVIRRK
jgi:sigma-B regulation protein RsbU (phosphoserine phosphatase)